jgi:crotonobetaine/carnitine-CoA ligase
MEEGFLELLSRAAARECVFARFDGGDITIARLDIASDRLAAGLLQRGLVRGDRVAVMLRNGPLALTLIFALAKAGLIWVPVNVQLRGASLRYILEHAEPRLLIIEPDLLDTLGDCGAAIGRLALPEDLREAKPVATVLPGPGETFAISYTSGTTGPPKGVLVSHRMLRLAGEGAALVSGARDGDVMFVWEPFYHIGGAQLVVVPLLHRVVLHMAPRFSASAFWAEVARSGATQIHYLGGILPILLKQPPGPQDRAHRVRVAWGGGCPPSIWREVETRYGVEVHECYGMTEASSFTTFNANGIVGSVGRPLPWFDVTVQDGEIVVRSTDPHAITNGYLRNPEATARTLRHGALHTGDSGAWDSEGNLIFHGRLTDNVRVRGENVSAWEVEHVAAGHPEIADCAMIGVAAEIGEQEIKLFVQTIPGATLTPAALSAWLAERLPPYQRPRYLVFVAGFDRTPSQRIAKHSLSRFTHEGWDRMNPETPR